MLLKYLSYLWNFPQHFRNARLSFRQWFREDSRYFFISTLIHAIIFLTLGLLPWRAITSMDNGIDGSEPSFKPAEVEAGEAPELVDVIFERGDPQYENSVLDPKMLAQMEALPVGSETGERDLSPDEIGDPNGDPLSEVTTSILTGTGGTGDYGSGGMNRPGPGPHPGAGVKGIFGPRGKIGGIPWGMTGPQDRAVGAALNWLERHQAVNGSWSLDHRSRCRAGGTCSAAGTFKSDSAATALALLPFLAAGETHKSNGPYEKHVAAGLAWLLKQQSSTGDLSGLKDPNNADFKPMYAHTIATIALCEAYGMTKDDPKTRDEKLFNAARKAVGYIERAQNESTGGWRYIPNVESDTSVFGWAIMALKSAELAEIPVNSLVFDKAKIWLNSVAKGEHLGLYSYMPYKEVTPTMTAVGMLCRQYMGTDPRGATILEGKKYLMENPPDDLIGRNTYYWYYATLTMHNFNDADWDAWNRRLRKVLIDSQATQGCATGSWDPEHPSADFYGQQGGRLMTTALNTLTLEVFYRYMPLFQTDTLLPKTKLNHQILPADQPLEK
jgi:hypothetical protein